MREVGLIYRRSFPIDRGRVVVEEKWDISVPGCPYIRSPWAGGLETGPVFVRQREMTADEFEQANIPMFTSA